MQAPAPARASATQTATAYPRFQTDTWAIGDSVKLQAANCVEVKTARPKAPATPVTTGH